MTLFLVFVGVGHCELFCARSDTTALAEKINEVRGRNFSQIDEAQRICPTTLDLAPRLAARAIDYEANEVTVTPELHLARRRKGGPIGLIPSAIFPISVLGIDGEQVVALPESLSTRKSLDFQVAQSSYPAS